MPQLRDFLGRFRPAGTPGAAARAGVPADPAGELAAEVGPVLALLDGAAAGRDEVIAAARRDAAAIVAAARDAAAGVAADGEQRAAAARDEAARLTLAAARDEAELTVTAARQQASRIRELSAQRTPGLADRAVAEIRQLVPR
jgi:hypothetical protein